MIRSLLDNDLYKMTMANCVMHQFSNVNVEYTFNCRSNYDLRHMIAPITKEIQNLCNLKLTSEELEYLRSIPYLSSDLIDFLEDFQLKSRFVSIKPGLNNLDITIKGPWLQTIFFEVPVLAIVQECYTNSFLNSGYYEALAEGEKRLQRKIDLLKKSNLDNIKFSDFGTRRRFSGVWHKHVVFTLVNNFTPNVFTGTSNILLAKEYNIKPIGTHAHEFICAGQALPNVRLRDSQKYMLEAWVKEFRANLGIALTDSISMDAFLLDFDLYLAKLYDGCRHDSGDPFVWCEKLINHYKKLKIDPMSKTAVFSDGLDFPKMIKIAKKFKGQINTAFGIGTNLTNDSPIEALSLVMKLTSVNGNPVAKLSDNPAKCMCQDRSYLDYLKSVFNFNG